MRALHPVVNSAVALFLLAWRWKRQRRRRQQERLQTRKRPQRRRRLLKISKLPNQHWRTETQSVHIQVGRSIILNTQSRLRRIVVSNPDVLDTVTVSTSQVVVTAKAAGSSSLVLWDEASNARILDVYADVDVSGSRRNQGGLSGRGSRGFGGAGKSSCQRKGQSKAVQDDILRMASSYSKDVVDSTIFRAIAEKQVMLKVRFPEVDRIKLRAVWYQYLEHGSCEYDRHDSTGQFGAPSLRQFGTALRRNWQFVDRQPDRL